MGAFRGVIVFGTYLAFFEWTKSLGPDAQNDATGESTPRIIGEELAKFVAISTLVVVITYKIAPHNINPEAVWWVAIIGIAVFAIWLWRDKETKASAPDQAASKPVGTKIDPVLARKYGIRKSLAGTYLYQGKPVSTIEEVTEQAKRSD